jgi:SAM-dependent methyltransferase
VIGVIILIVSMAKLTRYERSPHLAPLVREWQAVSRVHETTVNSAQQRIIHQGQTNSNKPRIPCFLYTHNRVEQGDSMHLNAVYPISPKEILIPELIKSNPQRKIKILDLGAGSAQYTDLLRSNFEGKIKVFSTGISKRAAKEARKKDGLSRLHSNDLKWRSIEELKDKQEYDLILSSYGEIFYGTKPNPQNATVEKELEPKLYTKLKKIMMKLNDGGIACFGPAKDLNTIKNILKKLSVELNFKYDFRAITDGESSLFQKSYQVLIRKKC